MIQGGSGSYEWMKAVKKWTHRQHRQMETAIRYDVTGCSQKRGFDFNETYLHVARICCLSLKARFKKCIKMMFTQLFSMETSERNMCMKYSDGFAQYKLVCNRQVIWVKAGVSCLDGHWFLGN